MTLREVSQPEKMNSASTTQTQTQVLDPNKAKSARRRRVEIQKLKATSSKQNIAVNGGVTVMCEAHGVVSVMGRRREMEDSVRMEPGLVEVQSRVYDFYGVYDGHGGSHVAEACGERMHSILVEELGEKDTWRGIVEGVDWEGVMVRCFDRMDREVGGGGKVDEMEEMTVGSTAVTAVVGKEEVVVANCGDSRAIICRNGVSVPLSFDHKPDRPDELARIEGAGGRVINWNGFRVLGVLATSRSIGDHYLRPYVLSTPEVTISRRTKDDEFLILATDGLWDVISNEVACQVVRRCLAGKIHRKSPYVADGLSRNRSSRAQVAAALLVELAMSKGSKDNISVIVVELSKKLGRITCVHSGGLHT